jgi:hypothetical protein
VCGKSKHRASVVDGENFQVSKREPDGYEGGVQRDAVQDERAVGGRHGSIDKLSYAQAFVFLARSVERERRVELCGKWCARMKSWY